MWGFFNFLSYELFLIRTIFERNIEVWEQLTELIEKWVLHHFTLSDSNFCSLFGSLLLTTFQIYIFTSYDYLYEWKTIFTFQMVFLQITDISEDSIITSRSLINEVFHKWWSTIIFSGTRLTITLIWILETRRFYSKGFVVSVLIIALHTQNLKSALTLARHTSLMPWITFHWGARREIRANEPARLSFLAVAEFNSTLAGVSVVTVHISSCPRTRCIFLLPGSAITFP